MTENEALLAAIVADPDDDLPRLAYADWLEENGNEADRDRAEFIRVQCQLALLPAGDSREKDLHKRQWELFTTHRGTWGAGGPRFPGITSHCGCNKVRNLWPRS